MNEDLKSRLPDFIHRSEVVQILGIDYHAVDDMRVVLEHRDQPVPVGKIGAIQGMSRRRNRQGRGYYLYRSADVLSMRPRQT